jgi:hypothetical protein
MAYSNSDSSNLWQDQPEFIAHFVGIDRITLPIEIDRNIRTNVGQNDLPSPSRYIAVRAPDLCIMESHDQDRRLLTTYKEVILLRALLRYISLSNPGAQGQSYTTWIA